MERAELRAWLRAAGGIEERGDAMFLCDPGWTSSERAQANALIAQVTDPAHDQADGWLCVRTGGTGGGVKFARHDEKTLAAAVRGFCSHFALSRVNAVGVLPLHHVSGLMARIRCAMTGGNYFAWDWKRLEAGERPIVSRDDFVLSLVPTQLHRLLGIPAMVDWLRAFRIIFVGGGPVWPQLADAAAGAKLRISLSYGMTETAAMVTALSPEDFLVGARDCGTALAHARVAIAAGDVVKIASESLFHGYWPEWRETREFTTEDIGAINRRGHLEIFGRRDAMIITGGKKVQPSDVEAALHASGEFTDIVVVGVPDPEWGEAVVACYPAAGQPVPDFERAVAGLAAHQRPKRFVAVADWPRNAQGKINRTVLRAAAMSRD